VTMGSDDGGGIRSLASLLRAAVCEKEEGEREEKKRKGNKRKK
jgi:hypothetical protein